MSFEEQTARIEYLIALIDGANTGNADNLAKKLSVSRRTVFNDLDFLKGKGHEIAYNHCVCSYVFAKDNFIYEK